MQVEPAIEPRGVNLEQPEGFQPRGALGEETNPST
jgi:hypothetical protein